MMKTGGCSAEPRRHGSRLAGPHPCLPPEGEGEEARGEEVHLSRLCSLPRWGRVGVGAARRGRRSPHPCPLPQAGEGVHAKFIAASACYMGAGGILHDGNWRLSCSAAAAWIKAGWPPSLPSPSGGRRESQRGKGSPLPPLFPPPLGEGEGGSRQKRKKLPHPCPPASIPSPAGGGWGWGPPEKEEAPSPLPSPASGRGSSYQIHSF